MELTNEYNLVARKENIFGDNFAYIEYYDFSRSNISNDERIKAVTKVASICYQNPKAFGSESLYNRLAAESHSLPSSSFEFVPMLFTQEEVNKCYLSMTGNIPTITIHNNNPLTKFGEWIEDGKYLLTNFRAVVYLFEQFGIDFRDKFNTEEECKIIAKHFKVFKYYVDLPTRAQMVRHRVNWQELSRRYVSGKRVEFQFYISEKMKFVSSHIIDGETQCIDEEEFNNICVERYNQALDRGVKPEEARRCIPQSMYTTIWGAFQPSQLENYFKLRSDSHAQKEIRATSDSMKELLGA